MNCFNSFKRSNNLLFDTLNRVENRGKKYAKRVVIANPGRVLKKRVLGFNFKKPGYSSWVSGFQKCTKLALFGKKIAKFHCKRCFGSCRRRRRNKVYFYFKMYIPATKTKALFGINFFDQNNIRDFINSHFLQVIIIDISILEIEPVTQKDF